MYLNVDARKFRSETVKLPHIHVQIHCNANENCEKGYLVNPFTPRVSYGDTKVIRTFESVDEILWCDHSNETSSAVLSHGTIYF